MGKTFDSDEAIVAWADSLDERWPEREAIGAHVIALLETYRCSQPMFVELCPGDGRLAKQVIEAVPDADYVGLEASADLADYAGRAGLDVRVADVGEPKWANLFDDPVDAVFTVQSLHDVGDAETTARAYGACRNVLRPGGILVTADFIVESFDTEKPGRLTLEQHMAMLERTGFDPVAVSLTAGALTCLRAEVPG